MAAALFICLTMGAGLKGDEAALVPVALERGGSRVRQRSVGHVGGSTTLVDGQLAVEEKFSDDAYTFKELIGSKVLWKYLGKPKTTLAIGNPPLPRQFYLRLMKKVARRKQEVLHLELRVLFTPNSGHRDRQQGLLESEFDEDELAGIMAQMNENRRLQPQTPGTDTLGSEHQQDEDELQALERGGRGRVVEGVVIAAYSVEYVYLDETGNQQGCAASFQEVFATQTHTDNAHVDPGCKVSAAILFTAVAGVAMNLRSKDLTLQDSAKFPQCIPDTVDKSWVYQSSAYLIMYGQTFYEYKARQLIGGYTWKPWKKKATLMTQPSDAIADMNVLKAKWKKSLFSRTRKTTTLRIGTSTSEASVLWRMCYDKGEEAYKEEHRRRCSLIWNRRGGGRTRRKRTSANVYQVHRRPAGPNARAQP